MIKTVTRSIALAAAIFCAAAGVAAASSFPEIYVTDTVLDQAGPFKAGQTVTGHFTVQNLGGDAADLPTSLNLMTSFEDGFPKILVDAYLLPSIHVAPRATLQVPFSVALPKAFTGEAGFQGNVEIGLGWNRSGLANGPFKVEGGLARADVDGYTMDLSNGRRVNPLSGPSIYRDKEPKTATLTIFVKSPEAFAVTPKIELFESTNAIGTRPLWTGSAGRALLDAGTTTVVSAPLPTLSYPDKVVFGTFRLVDDQGVDRSGITYFRYIPRTGQEIGRLTAFSFGGEPVPGTPLVVRANVAGNPVDFDAPPPTDMPPATFTVEALDDDGQVVATAATSTVLGPSATALSLRLDLPDAPHLTYQARLVSSAGRTLDQRSGNLFGQPKPPFWGTPGVLALLATLGIAIIGLIVILVIFRRRPPAAAAGIVGGALVVAALILSTSGAQVASATDAAPANPAVLVTDVTSGLTRTAPTISVDFSQPLPSPYTYQCGATVPVIVTAAYDVCTNSGVNTDFKLFLDGTLIKEVKHTESSTDNHNDNVPDHQVFGETITVNAKLPLPVRNGTYTLKGDMVARAWETWHVVKEVTFQVAGCDQCPNITGDQSAVPAGMSKTTAGDCVCPTGYDYDVAHGQCQHGGTALTDCPNGYKWCNGACVTEDTACAPAPGACPVPPSAQACVEIFNGAGNRTDQLQGLSLDDLEKVFGFGLREAYYAQADEVKAGLPTHPIFGAIGRSSSVSVVANQGSAGCGGVVCAYGVNGCNDAVDQGTGKVAAECSPLGAGAGGLAPNAQIQVVPSVVGKGGHCKVSWSSHAMASCQIAGNGISSSALAGSTSTPALVQSAAYLLTCQGQDGKTYKDAESCSVNPDVKEF